MTQDKALCHNGSMTWIIAGLGNPGEEYKNTRHNVGRMMLQALVKANDAEEFSFDKKMNALVSEIKVKKDKAKLKKSIVPPINPKA